MESFVKEFAGTWELEDSFSEKEGVKIAFPLGKNVIGRINYDVLGNMAAQLMSGNDQVRYFEMTEKNLILKTPPMRGQDGQKSVHTLIWKKITT
jgi:hypothetical protein